MKLDKMKFAQVVAYCARRGMDMDSDDVQTLDSLIDIDVPQANQYVPVEAVDDLLKQMAMNEKIPAIRAYRMLTGAGLKESKDAVEKYWLRQPAQAD